MHCINNCSEPGSKVLIEIIQPIIILTSISTTHVLSAMPNFRYEGAIHQPKLRPPKHQPNWVLSVTSEAYRRVAGLGGPEPRAPPRRPGVVAGRLGRGNHLGGLERGAEMKVQAFTGPGQPGQPGSLRRGRVKGPRKRQRLKPPTSTGTIVGPHLFAGLGAYSFSKGDQLREGNSQIPLLPMGDESL